MTFMTPVYDLLKKRVDAKTPEDLEGLAVKLAKDLGVTPEVGFVRLQNAIKALNAKPEDRGSATSAEVETLIHLAAYSLTEGKQQSTEACKCFVSVFQNSVSLCQEKGEVIDNEDLKWISDNIKEKPYLACSKMACFLFALTPQQNPFLFDAMLNELRQYPFEKLSNLERNAMNLQTDLSKTTTNQSLHADYLQGWERVGYMGFKVVYGLFAMALHTALEPLGFKTPLAAEEDNNQSIPLIRNPSGPGVIQNPNNPRRP